MTVPSRPRLVCDNVGLSYPSRAGVVHALSGVSFTLYADEFVCIVGPSGCGKSSLLRLLAGLQRPTAGSIRHTAAPTTTRPQTSMVFQEHGLFPWLNLWDNVAFGLEAQNVPAPERRRRADALLEQFGLAPFRGHFPHELSVGMRQRAALARAMLSEPQTLLMDEPFSSVDAQSRRLLQEELLSIWQERSQLVVFVTHDIDEAVLLADRIIVLSGRPGRVQQIVNVPLARPRDPGGPQQAAARDISWHIWKNIEGEVRQRLLRAG
jgi:NitT/TauT family transport system ATP-binding protein